MADGEREEEHEGPEEDVEAEAQVDFKPLIEVRISSFLVTRRRRRAVGLDRGRGGEWGWDT
eukprot:768000-Hanusia_phi.AAC.3